MLDTLIPTLIPAHQEWLIPSRLQDDDDTVLRIQIRWKNELDQLITDAVRAYEDWEVAAPEDERMILVEARSRARDLAFELGFATMMRIERFGKPDEYRAFSSTRPCGCCPCCTAITSSFQA